MIDSLFSTNVFLKKCNLNISLLEEKCREHQKTVSSVKLSNNGGYQGHNFYDSDLLNEIISLVPVRPEKQLNDLSVDFWVNINKLNDWNDLHNHGPYHGVFLSGVFYVKTPENCGRLRLYDPRLHICNSLDMNYYNDGHTYHFYEPEKNMLIIFPSWIHHMVEPNKSHEDRISISFNLTVSG